MGNRSKGLNEMLVNLFNQVMSVESQAVITEEYKDISNNDMHILEAVGIDKPRNMSEIAKRLSVTVGTLTTNMNGLEKKGYVIRTRSEDDRRVVLITLTERGRKAFFHHRDFHKQMIRAVVGGLDEDEKRVLYKCLIKLDDYFNPQDI
ncbi:MAG: MarR family transcriptional regulator [Lachnospiraceae bacterium]|nr:MarR family transcriptional regulator [Lachnospiraceae bacterium]